MTKSDVSKVRKPVAKPVKPPQARRTVRSVAAKGKKNSTTGTKG